MRFQLAGAVIASMACALCACATSSEQTDKQQSAVAGTVAPTSIGAFAAQQASKYTLPLPYLDIRETLVGVPAGIEAVLGASFDPILNSGTGACGGPLYEAGANLDWPELAQSAQLLRSGAIITAGDPELPNLSAQLQAEFLRIADYFISKANVHSSDVSSIYGISNPGMIGWNVWINGWDAFQNGTCSPARAPNAYDAYTVLEVLADAYLLTNDSKYLQALIDGSVFFNAGVPVTSALAQAEGGAAKQRIINTAACGTPDMSTCASPRPYAITATYTAGGSRFSGSTPSQQVIRYHYFADDPGYFAQNITSGLGLVMTLAGVASPGSIYTMVDPVGGGALNRSFANIGHWSMYSIYGNVNARNYGYLDIDDSHYSSSAFEGSHTEFTLYHLARAGVMTNDQNFVAAARNGTVDILNQIAAGTASSQGVADGYFCLMRSLDPSIGHWCRQFAKNNKEVVLNSYDLLWAAINVMTVHGHK
jgi:hypothetical protein